MWIIKNITLIYQIILLLILLFQLLVFVGIDILGNFKLYTSTTSWLECDYWQIRTIHIYISIFTYNYFYSNLFESLKYTILEVLYICLFFFLMEMQNLTSRVIPQEPSILIDPGCYKKANWVNQEEQGNTQSFFMMYASVPACRFLLWLPALTSNSQEFDLRVVRRNKSFPPQIAFGHYCIDRNPN